MSWFEKRTDVEHALQVLEVRAAFFVVVVNHARTWKSSQRAVEKGDATASQREFELCRWLSAGLWDTRYVRVSVYVLMYVGRGVDVMGCRGGEIL